MDFYIDAFIQNTHVNSSFAARYITSLLAKPFVILTGNSGTGKTKIAVDFAKYLSAESIGIKNFLKTGDIFGEDTKRWQIVKITEDVLYVKSDENLNRLRPLPLGLLMEYVMYISENPDKQNLANMETRSDISNLPNAGFDKHMYGFHSTLILIAKEIVKRQKEQKSSANEKNWLLVPVGADWTDNTKILGYYNPLANGGAGEYVESEILRLIERANANPALPFFLILDEMNLSHVERYFSDFLSKMETPGDPFEIDHYGTLRFPENLFITGTVNIDETTYMFSPKVLDRANVIEFKPTTDELFDDATGSSSGEVVTAEDGMAEAFMHLASKVRKDNSPLGQELTDSLKEIYGILDGYGFEFAFRTVNEIRLYMAAARELGTEETALDEQVLQKILPKIHGNRKQIGEMLDRLEEKCGSLKLAASTEKIVWMKSRLERFQYASFV